MHVLVTGVINNYGDKIPTCRHVDKCLFYFIYLFLPFLAVDFFIAGLWVRKSNQNKSAACIGTYTMCFNSTALCQ